ncbi:Pre-mRNA-processing factor 17 [Vitis vinifera]|uniref:Pre-mRNA-processing factor 17 n=1 Tax=Vitis vinifera TaxID=29760 RepID=A0A438JN52_VITVI|nr:Pre-mRNA-processing factor 17 [Vitis vinifera]
MRNHKLGFVENAAIEPFIFDEQYNTFHKYGYAADPSASAGNNYVGDLEALEKNDGISVYNIPQHEQKKRKIEKKKESESEENEDVDVEEVQNPATDTWLLKNKKSPWAGKKEGLQTELTEEQKKYAEEYAKKKGEEKGAAEKGEFVTDKSTFHGKEERDYQGRSWIAPPKDAKATNDHCYIPKRLVAYLEWTHEGCVCNSVLPQAWAFDSLSWDGYQVRDISFCNDGTKFLTAGYDKNIKYWDTETGQVISTFSTGKIPYVVKLNPDDDKQNILLAGMSDKKIVQWDMNTGQITQEYDQHLGAVNTITFVDNNRRFVTSSDDKSLRVWEFGIPLVIKVWDNQILIYSTRERFQLNKRRGLLVTLRLAMLAKSISHQMDGLSCLEMVKVNAGFGTGRVAKSSEHSSVMKGYASGVSGILWNKVK